MDPKENEPVYQKAVEIAKSEFDEAWPLYKQLSERIKQLRMLITAGSDLLNDPLEGESNYRRPPRAPSAPKDRQSMQGNRQPQPRPPTNQGGPGHGRA